jgi:hypothetical protein
MATYGMLKGLMERAKDPFYDNTLRVADDQTLDAYAKRYTEPQRVPLTPEAAAQSVGNPPPQQDRIVGQAPVVAPKPYEPLTMEQAARRKVGAEAPRSAYEAALNRMNQETNLLHMAGSGFGGQAGMTKGAKAAERGYLAQEGVMEAAERGIKGETDRYIHKRNEWALAGQQVQAQADEAKANASLRAAEERNRGAMDRLEKNIDWGKEREKARATLKNKEFQHDFDLLQQKYSNDKDLTADELAAEKEKLSIQHANAKELLQSNQNYLTGQADLERSDKHIQIAAKTSERQAAVKAFLETAKTSPESLTESERKMLRLMREEDMAASGMRFLPKDFMLKEIKRLESVRWGEDANGNLVYEENGKKYNLDGTEYKK